MSDPLLLRPYIPADEEAAIALWRRTWQQAYPNVDFAARTEWWRARWRNLLVPHAAIVVAERHGTAIGFVTLDKASGYLDQIVVAPEHWGDGTADRLLAEAKRLAPCGIELHVNADNARALRFYARHGFGVAGDAINERSGAPVYRMRWPA